MTKHRSHSIEFKRQVAQEFLGGETLHGLAKRHDIGCERSLRIRRPRHECRRYPTTRQTALQARSLSPIALDSAARRDNTLPYGEVSGIAVR